MAGDTRQARIGNVDISRLGRETGTNPFLDDVVGRTQRGINRSYDENVLPSLHGVFGSAGGTGGALHGILSNRANEDRLRQVGDAASNIYYKAYDDTAGRNLQRDITATRLGESGRVSDLEDAREKARLAEMTRQFNASHALAGDRLGLDRERLGEQRRATDLQIGLGRDRLGEQRRATNQRDLLERARLKESGRVADLQVGLGRDRLGEQRRTTDLRIGLDTSRLNEQARQFDAGERRQWFNALRQYQRETDPQARLEIYRRFILPAIQESQSRSSGTRVSI